MRRVKTKDLQEALATAALFGATHSPVDHYLFCKVKTVMGGLSLLCSSMAGVCQTKVEGEGTESFVAFVPIKRFRDVLQTVSDEYVSLSCKDGALCVTSGLGSISIAMSEHVVELPTIEEAEWVNVGAKASAEEIRFFATFSATSLLEYIKVQGKRATMHYGSISAWVEDSSLLWMDGVPLGIEAAKLLCKLLSSIEGEASACIDGGKLAVKWGGGVALLLGVAFQGRGYAIPAEIFKVPLVPVCEVSKKSIFELTGACQAVSLVEHIGATLTIADGNIGVTKRTAATGSVKLSVPCSTFSSEAKWIIDPQKLASAAKAIGGELACIDSMAINQAEPDVPALIVHDKKHYVAICPMDEISL